MEQQLLKKMLVESFRFFWGKAGTLGQKQKQSWNILIVLIQAFLETPKTKMNRSLILEKSGGTCAKM